MSESKYHTGDILFFRGTDTSFDVVIETVTQSPYTHVAMIIVNPSWIETPGTYVIQSLVQSGTTEACEQNTHQSGVQMNLLSEIRLKHTDIRRLSVDVPMEKLCTIHARVHNIPYDYNVFHWILGGLRAMGLPCFAPRHRDTFWCSALVSYIYTELGLLESSTDWSTISPADLSTMDIPRLGTIESFKK